MDRLTFGMLRDVRGRPAAVLSVLMMTGLAALLQGCADPAPASASVSLRPLWRAALPAGAEVPSGTPAASDDGVFVVASGLHGYSIATGRPLWLSPLRAYVPRALVATPHLVIVPESTVYSLDPRSGRRLWEFTPDANTSLGRAAVDGQSLYVGSAGHRIYALRIPDGTVRWEADLGPDWTFPAVVRGVAVDGGSVYVAVEQWLDAQGQRSMGWLVALDAASGAVHWRYGTQSAGERRGLSSSPLLTANLVVTSDFLSNAIEAVDRKTGHAVWRFHGLPGYSGFPEAPILIGDTIYAGSGDTYVYALALTTGELRWRTRLPASASSYARCGHALLVNDQALTVIDPASGAIVQTELGGESDFPTAGIAVSGHTAVTLGPKAIHAFHCS